MGVVSFRCESMLRDCLRSLRANGPSRGLRIHVVDNASSDGTPAMVEREFPDVTLTRSTVNLGFGRATNIVIREGSNPYILALNPDTRVTPNSLDQLLQLMDEMPEVGMLGCRLIQEDGSFDHASRRAFPTPLSALGHFTGIGRRLKRGPLAAYRAPQLGAGPVDAVNGAFMLMRRTALHEVGGFDERYWMYMEDLDLCYRFKQANWLTWYEPSVEITHIKAGTSGKNRSLRLNYAFHWGMYRFYRDHYSPTASPITKVAVYIGIIAKFTVSVVASLARRRLTGLRA